VSVGFNFYGSTGLRSMIGNGQSTQKHNLSSSGHVTGRAVTDKGYLWGITGREHRAIYYVASSILSANQRSCPIGRV
jgi:hypothetical protein